MNITRVCVDIAKTVFHVHAVDRHGRTQWQAKLTRGRWIESLCEHVDPVAEIGIEACVSAHHWGRAVWAIIVLHRSSKRVHYDN